MFEVLAILYMHLFCYNGHLILYIYNCIFVIYICHALKPLNKEFLSKSDGDSREEAKRLRVH